MKDERINALLRKEHVSTLSEWAENFRKNRKVFKHSVYLPLLSEFGNLHIQPCDVTIDVPYGPVFMAIPSQTVVDYTRGKDNPRYLYVVVRSDEDRISAVFTTVPEKINQFHSRLEEFSRGDPHRVELFLSIATHYRNEAQRQDKLNHLAALPDWQQASNYYKQLLDLSSIGTMTRACHQISILDYCRCLIKLHRYSRLTEHLTNVYHIREQTSNLADIWLVYAQATRKLGDYSSAKLWIQKAVELEPLSVDVKREQKAINLKDERQSINQPADFNTRISSLDDQRPWFNILSIDGGGIRGIIPAVWLMEIERKLRQPISTIFHAIAGTSTGAVIAAGLSAPSLTQTGKPRYQAHDLVQLYQTKANQVFTKSPSTWTTIRARFLQVPLYLDEGRKRLFEEYFGALRLSDALTELIVPSVRAESNTTDISTRECAVKDTSKNLYLRDMLMCTTAAPTYFPAYAFNNTVYVDGGVQANNPAMFAYTHVLNIYCSSIDKSRIRLLSLGTGDYVPDPLHPTANRDLLFWYRNRQTVLKAVMDGPQNNIDTQLGEIIRDEYYRWQVWLENPIQLDDIQPATIDRLIDLAHEQLEEMEAYDNRQRLGCLIEKLRSPTEVFT